MERSGRSAARRWATALAMAAVVAGALLAGPAHAAAQAAAQTPRARPPALRPIRTVERVGSAALPSTAPPRLRGRAAYGRVPGMRVLDLEARLAAERGVWLSVRLVARGHLPGRSLPLRFRGRQRELVLGVRVPAPTPSSPRATSARAGARR